MPQIEAMKIQVLRCGPFGQGNGPLQDATAQKKKGVVAHSLQSFLVLAEDYSFHLMPARIIV
jgi:hypothetical protein